MKKIKVAAFLWALSALPCLAYADAAFQSSDDVLGNWKLEFTKKSLTVTENIKREDSWSFSNGKVTITHIPRDGAYYDQTPVNYEVEGGKLKISLLGRPGKFDVFSLVEKSERSMTLKGQYGDIYQFSRK